MNAFRPTAPFTPTPAPARAAATPVPARLDRRERDFGVGYGRSSGYASARRYTQDWAAPRFRCA